MSNTSNSDKTDKVEVITSVQRLRQWTVAEKLQMVEESELPGMSVSYVARKYGVSPSQLFTWRKLARESKLSARKRGGGSVNVAPESSAFTIVLQNLPNEVG